MGNTEVKQLVQRTPLDADEIDRLQALYRTHGAALRIDRAVFASVFDANRVSYHVVDRLFDAFETDADGGIGMHEFALGLTCCDRRPVRDKLEFLFTVLTDNGVRRLTRADLRQALSAVFLKTLRRVRGQDGKWPDRECAGCKRVPVGALYACADCCTGFAFGVPITVHLCEDCHRQWEGPLEERNTPAWHRTTHRLLCANGPARGPVEHAGVQCSACGALPIPGTCHLCTVCADLLALCDACLRAQAEPLAHCAAHACTALEGPLSAEGQVLWLVDALDLHCAGDSQEGPASLAEFVAQGLRSELAVNVLNGLGLRYVTLCPTPESVQGWEDHYGHHPQLGRVDLHEMAAAS